LLQNQNNAELHARSIKRLHEEARPDGLFFMMDLAVEAGAMGIPVRFSPHEPPSIDVHPVHGRDDLAALQVLDPACDARLLSYVDAMSRLAHDSAIPVPIGAYVTGPYTLAALMMGMTDVALATRKNPALAHDVLGTATQVITRYATMLHEAGADMIAVLEPSAVLLSPTAFDAFSGAYLRKIASGISTDWILHICGNSTHLVPSMAGLGFQALSLDTAVSLPDVAKMVPETTILIGNVHPVEVVAQGNPDTVRSTATGLLNQMAGVPNFILSTGCDVPYEAPIANVRALVEAVHDGAHD
jgi:uroporphyrinogen decarboxylase